MTEVARRRAGWWVVGVLVLAVAVAAVGLVVTATASPTSASPSAAAPAGTTTPAGTTPAPHPLPTSSPSPETRTLSPAAAAAAEQQLSGVAAQLPGGIALTSPAAWDAWGPEGKSYPGADTADDLSTCPVVSARVGAALGVPMSYWVGTLPGPTGCSYATVPLQSGPDPYTYAYQLRVSFSADGSTPTSLRDHYFQLQGQVCPSVDAPSVGSGAVLVGCTEEPGFPGYVLLLPDARGAGTWAVEVDTRSNAAHTTEEALAVFLDALAGVYG
jgi:hypothetical protein